MHVADMCLEITRRCNMRCAHCMRGEPQRLDMTPEIIRQVFTQIDSISSLTLTGGEPSMKPELIHDVWQELLWQKTSLGYFYVVTNAHSTYRRKQFLEELDQLHQQSAEPEMDCLVVSQDQFHRWEHQPNLRYYQDHYEYDWAGGYIERDWIKLDQRHEDIRNVRTEGRAVEMSVGTVDPMKQGLWEVSEYNGEMYVSEHSVCISANGNVTSSPNMSFARVDREAWGNILETPLCEIIERNCEYEIEFKEVAVA